MIGSTIGNAVASRFTARSREFYSEDVKANTERKSGPGAFSLAGPITSVPGPATAASRTKLPSFSDGFRNFISDPVGSLQSGVASFARRLGIDYTTGSSTANLPSIPELQNTIEEVVVTGRRRLSTFAENLGNSRIVQALSRASERYAAAQQFNAEANLAYSRQALATAQVAATFVVGGRPPASPTDIAAIRNDFSEFAKRPDTATGRAFGARAISNFGRTAPTQRSLDSNGSILSQAMPDNLTVLAAKRDIVGGQLGVTLRDNNGRLYTFFDGYQPFRASGKQPLFAAISQTTVGLVQTVTGVVGDRDFAESFALTVLEKQALSGKRSSMDVIGYSRGGSLSMFFGRQIMLDGQISSDNYKVGININSVSTFGSVAQLQDDLFRNRKGYGSGAPPLQILAGRSTNYFAGNDGLSGLASLGRVSYIGKAVDIGILSGTNVLSAHGINEYLAISKNSE